MHRSLAQIIQKNKNIYTRTIKKSALKEVENLYSKPNLRVEKFARKINVPVRKVLHILSRFEIREYNRMTRLFHPELRLVTDHLGILHQTTPFTTCPRPPIVSVMGHVDHGKTTLLDSLRDTNVAESEPGLITQHVSSFVVNFKGRDVTFIDTPGHAAFSGIRGRGAKINDVTVLVVDCCEGVRSQTREVIDLIKKYEIPCVVALNKIDRANADVSRTEQELFENGVELVKFDGNIPSVEISALKRINLDNLVREIISEADNLNLEADVDTNAFGFVLETKKCPTFGGLSTILPLQGKIRIRTIINSGLNFCSVRNIFLPSGGQAEEISPGYPCTISGWKRGLPKAGLRFINTPGFKIAARMSKKPPLQIPKRLKEKKLKTKVLRDNNEVTEIKGDKGTLCLILKSDTEGSKEALENILTSTTPENLRIQLFSSKVGDITVTDIRCAKALNAHVLGYNVKLHFGAEKELKQTKIPIFTHNIVYRIIDYVREELTKMLEPTLSEKHVGFAEIISGPSQLDFTPPYKCKLLEGRIDRQQRFRIISTDGVVRYDGELREIESGGDSIKPGGEFEIRFEFYGEYDLTDRVECYEIIESSTQLVWSTNTD